MPLRGAQGKGGARWQWNPEPWQWLSEFLKFLGSWSPSNFILYSLGNINELTSYTFIYPLWNSGNLEKQIIHRLTHLHFPIFYHPLVHRLLHIVVENYSNLILFLLFESCYPGEKKGFITSSQTHTQRCFCRMDLSVGRKSFLDTYNISILPLQGTPHHYFPNIVQNWPWKKIF